MEIKRHGAGTSYLIEVYVVRHGLEQFTHTLRSVAFTRQGGSRDVGCLRSGAGRSDDMKWGRRQWLARTTLPLVTGTYLEKKILLVRRLMSDLRTLGGCEGRKVLG